MLDPDAVFRADSTGVRAARGPHKPALVVGAPGAVFSFTTSAGAKVVAIDLLADTQSVCADST